MMDKQLEDAVAVLDSQAQNAQANAAIHEAEGNHEQAALDRRVFDSCLGAIEKLKTGHQH